MRDRDLQLNIVGLSGLGLLAAGLWWMSPPVSLIIIGGVMFGVSMYGILRRQE